MFWPIMKGMLGRLETASQLNQITDSEESSSHFNTGMFHRQVFDPGSWAPMMGAFSTASRQAAREVLHGSLVQSHRPRGRPVTIYLQCLSYRLLKKSANAFGLGTPTPVTSSQPGAVFR
jgi:hypothetical protein